MNRKEEIRLEDKKHRKGFIVILACSMVLGFALGLGSVYLWDEKPENLAALSYRIVPMVGFVLLWVTFLTQWVISAVTKRRVLRMEREEGSEDAAEGKVNLVLYANAIAAPLCMTFFGMSGWGVRGAFEEMLGDADLFYLILAMVAVVTLFLQTGMMIYYLSWAVNYIKEHNPEKRGSVYQVSFNKKWLESCDEAERLYIYRSGYTGYRAGTYTCLGLWLAGLAGMMAGLTDWVCILFVGIVWTAMQIGYLVTAARLPGAKDTVTF